MFLKVNYIEKLSFFTYVLSVYSIDLPNLSSKYWFSNILKLLDNFLKYTTYSSWFKCFYVKLHNLINILIYKWIGGKIDNMSNIISTFIIIWVSFYFLAKTNGMRIELVSLTQIILLFVMSSSLIFTSNKKSHYINI